MTDGWKGKINAVTLYNTDDLGEDADKLFVPGGVEVTMTMYDYGNDKLALIYSISGPAVSDPTLPPEEPTVDATEVTVPETQPPQEDTQPTDNTEPQQPSQEPTVDVPEVSVPDTQPTQEDEQPVDDGNSQQPAVIGWVIGAVVLLGAAGGGAFLLFKRKK